MTNIGDIFVATWGYEQTNADFFQVVGLTKSSLKVRHIKHKTQESPQGSMSGYAIPIKNAFDGATKTKRIKYYNGQLYFEAGESMGSAELWDGRPVGISWYG